MTVRTDKGQLVDMQLAKATVRCAIAIGLPHVALEDLRAANILDSSSVEASNLWLNLGAGYPELQGRIYH